MSLSLYQLIKNIHLPSLYHLLLLVSSPPLLLYRGRGLYEHAQFSHLAFLFLYECMCVDHLRQHMRKRERHAAKREVEMKWNECDIKRQSKDIKMWKNMKQSCLLWFTKSIIMFYSTIHCWEHRAVALRWPQLSNKKVSERWRKKTRWNSFWYDKQHNKYIYIISIWKLMLPVYLFCSMSALLLYFKSGKLFQLYMDTCNYMPVSSLPCVPGSPGEMFPFHLSACFTSIWMSLILILYKT